MRRSFRERIRRAIADPVLQEALDNNADRRRSAQLTALETLPDSQELRARAREIRQQVITRLAANLEQFRSRAEENGFIVHQARDARAACSIVLQIAEAHQANLIVKSKSMVSEEIQLNHVLEEKGIKVVETDLGEYIVQLRHEHPAHIITPAIHLLKEQVAQTFQEKLGASYTSDVAEMTRTARQALRQDFLQADIGITGVNFGVVETGTLCLLTNEGNGRMVTTLPEVHIALMGIERMVPTLEDLALMLRLLPRSATGQRLTSYVNLIQGPKKTGDPDGAVERHLILIDNGRSRVNLSPIQESLLCIRCGACLNACPVFREAGGHAYQSVYPGPIGSVISPGLFGIEGYGYLAKASTLCGACRDACPVGIDFPTLLLRVRDETMRATDAASPIKMAMRIFSWTARSRWRFCLAQQLAAFGTRLLPRSDAWITWLPMTLSGWTDTRHFPPFNRRPLRARIKDAKLEPMLPQPREGMQSHIRETQPLPPAPSPTQEFRQELEALGGKFLVCEPEELPGLVIECMPELEQKRILSWGADQSYLEPLLAELAVSGFEVIHPEMPDQADNRRQLLEAYGSVEVGLSGALAGLADTATILLPGGRGRSQLVSLLPFHHIAVLPLSAIYSSLGAWLDDGGKQLIAGSSQITLISGPSRTADIEMTLTVGVHGPGELTVIGVKDSG